MRLLEYVNKFAPVFERKNLLNTLADLEEEYTATIGSILEELEAILLGKGAKSNILQRYRSDIMRRVNFQGDSLALLFTSLRNMPSNFTVVQGEVRRLFSFQFTNNSLTANRANVLRYIDAMSFYIQYARTLLLTAVTEASQSIGKATPSSFTPAERDAFASNMPQFCDLYVSMSMPAAALKARIASSADVEINDATFDLATRTLGDAKMDPLQLNGFSPQQNPLLLFGKYLAEVRVRNYEAAADEHRAMKYRLLEMQGMLDGDPTSPVLQKQIKMYEQRVSDFAFEMEATLKKANLEV